MTKAIVLSGGGAKGSYQIGFWKAIRRLHIKYDIVTGTSVGALNGLLFVQKDYRKAIHLWKKMDFNILFDEDELKKYNNVKTTNDMIKMFGNNAIAGGINVNKLENLVRKYVNYKKFKRKKINYGLVTYNITTLKPLYLTKDKMNEKNLVDFVMASASCYPFFQKRKIGKNYYIDGGFHDNMPIDFASTLGADEIIVVNLKAPGVLQKYKNNKAKITFIEPRNNLGSFLNFNRDSAIKGIKYGYNDTMKTFGKLDGKIFTFKKNNIRKSFNKNSLVLLNELEKLRVRKSINIDYYNDLLDYLGTSLSLDDTKIYRIKKFNKILRKNIENTKPISAKQMALIITDNENENLKRSIIKHFYNVLQSNNFKEIDKHKLIFKKEISAAAYLYLIARK